MNVAKLQLTEAAVIDETLAFFSKRGAFSAEAYFKTRNRGEYRSFPGDEVVTACAIGGVEQAIWKLTGDEITSDDRGALAYLTSEREADGRLSNTRKVYARVMGRLNRITLELFGDRLNVVSIEQLTGQGTHRTAKTNVMRVLKVAAEEVHAK